MRKKSVFVSLTFTTRKAEKIAWNLGGTHTEKAPLGLSSLLITPYMGKIYGLLYEQKQK